MESVTALAYYSSMKFEHETSPAPYLNRKDQYRLLGLVGLLTLIVFSIDYTRKPENWAWFFSIGQKQQQGELKELSLDELDFRIQEPESTELKPDEFVAVQNDEPKIDIEELGFDIGQIPQELLAYVEDRRVGLLRAEQPAMQLALQRVKTLTLNELEEAATDDVGFRVVFTDSEQYRGQLLKFEGQLWRLQPFPFGDPDSEEDDLWQAWAFSSDSGNNPWVIFMSEKPEGVESGEQIDHPISAAGYFFKNYGYATDEGLHIAPMLIAKTVRLKSVPTVPGHQSEDLSRYVVGVLALMGLFFGILIWRFSQSDRKFRNSRLAEIADSRLDATPGAIEDLNKLPTSDPREFLGEQRGEMESRSE